MVLQLTDFTSEITDEELREFTSEYYIPSALHPVVPAADASIADFPVGKVGVGKNIHFEVNCRPLVIIPHVLFVPCLLSYLVGQRVGIVFQARRALAVLHRKNCAPEALEGDVLLVVVVLVHCILGGLSMPHGLARSYFQRPEEVPTFIGEDGREMDLFSVVHLSKPKQVTEGRTMELVLEQPEIESTDKTQRASGDDGAGPSKRVRHLSLGLSTSTEEETPDALPTLAAKEVAALVAQLRARFSNERSQIIQKDEEILLL
ncbi:hypothetical protein Tco_1119835, partial [Tanacetum coccineum]